MSISFTVRGEGPSCLKSSSAHQLTCTKKSNDSSEKTPIGQTEPAFIAYRLAVKGSSERKCRFEPTCSQFLVEAIKRFGPIKGMKIAFARSQMKHDDQFGTLPTTIKDNFLIVLDPVSNWDDK